jgi:hypothetical protein
MAEDSRTSSDEASPDPGAGVDKDRDRGKGAPLSTSALEPGAPIPPDAVDPELLKLPVPLPRRHPLVAVAVLAVAGLLLYRLRGDISYALKPSQPVELGGAAAALKSGELARNIDGYVRLSGMPDRRNGLAFDPKGRRTRYHVFRLLGTGTRVFVSAPATPLAEAANQFTGRLRRFDDVSFADAVTAAYGQTLALRALDLPKLKALPPGPLPQPLSTLDRAGEALTVDKDRELLIDVLFADDVRVLLSKEKFPSEPDARYEVERLGVLHGPGLETRDGFGYVLRLPPVGPERQKLLAHLDSQGMFFQRRLETYRVPAASVHVTPTGLQIPGPDGLPQPVRYQAPPAPAAPEAAPAGGQAAPAPTATAQAGAAPAAADATSKLLVPLKEQATLLSWEQVQSVQISEPLTVPPDAVLLLDGEVPAGSMWTLPVALLLLCFIGFNVWYLLRSLSQKPGIETTR